MKNPPLSLEVQALYKYKGRWRRTTAPLSSFAYKMYLLRKSLFSLPISHSPLISRYSFALYAHPSAEFTCVSSILVKHSLIFHFCLFLLQKKNHFARSVIYSHGWTLVLMLLVKPHFFFNKLTSWAKLLQLFLQLVCFCFRCDL